MRRCSEPCTSRCSGTCAADARPTALTTWSPRCCWTYAPPVPVASDDPDLDLALGRLSPDDRELVRLWAWERLAPSEIAAVLDITANAASIRLHRAKARLADHLAARKMSPAAGHTGDGRTEEVP
jgi:DNA-directed RNA polymerase specialized sigma24 family protein